MVDSKLEKVMQHVRGLVSKVATADWSDATLLEAFLTASDQAAFAALVKRHGPLVLTVCRRVLHQEQDAEDAFQATFIVLARRAASIRKKNSVASWLHGVARQIALKAQRAAATRSKHETNVKTMEPKNPAWEAAWREVAALLDAEIQLLPDKYREPFIRCCLENQACAAVAQQLGLKEGTVWSRLAEARKRLTQRLAKRGVALPTVLTLIVGGQGQGAVAVPASLFRATVTASLALTGGKALSTGIISSQVVAMTDGALKAMVATKAMVGASLALMVVMTALSAGAVSYLSGADKPSEAKNAANPKPPSAKPKEVAAPKQQRPARTDASGDPLPDGAVQRLGTLRFRQGGGRINRLLISPDGKTLVSKSFYGEESVCVWEAATGRLLHQLPGQYQENRAVALSADGKTLAIGRDAVIVFYDEATGREVSRLNSPVGGTEGLAFSHDGKLLASGHAGAFVLLWDLAAQKVLSRLAAKHSRLTLLAFSSDNKFLATGNTLDQTICLFDVATGMERHQIHRPSFILDFAFAPTGAVLAIGAQDGVASLWDAVAGKLLRELRGTSQYVSAVAWSADGKTLATGGYDGKEKEGIVHLWNPETGEQQRYFKATGALVQSLAFTLDGHSLFCGGSNGIIRAWEPTTGQEKIPFRGLSGGVRGLVVSGDGKTLAYLDRDIHLWDLTEGRELGTLPGFHWSLAFSPDGRSLAGGSANDGKDGAINIWDVGTRKIRRRLNTSLQEGGLKWIAYYTVAFAPDGKTLASGNHELGPSRFDVFLRIWDPISGKELRRKSLKEGPNVLRTVERVTFSPDGRILLASGRAANPGDGKLGLWDAAGVKKLSRLETELNSSLGELPPKLPQIVPPRAVFSPDGRLLAMNRANGSIPVWETATGQLRCLLEGHEMPTVCVAFVADGKTLASSGWDQTIRLWDLETGKETQRFVGHRGKASALAFTPDGKSLISAGDDTTLLFWDVAAFTSRRRANERLSPEDFETLWTELAGGDAARAHRAIARLSAAPHVTVPALRRRLRQAPKVDSATVSRLVRELDADQFATREKASRELERLGEVARPVLEKERETASPEAQRRLVHLLDELEVPSNEVMRELRLVEVLERIATPDACALLANLAKGTPEARLTQDAKAAINRIGSRGTTAAP